MLKRSVCVKFGCGRWRGCDGYVQSDSGYAGRGKNNWKRRRWTAKVNFSSLPENAKRKKCRYYCENLIKESPKLYRARIAEKYLESLETGNEEPINHIEIFHDQSAHQGISKMILRSKIIRIICMYG